MGETPSLPPTVLESPPPGPWNGATLTACVAAILSIALGALALSDSRSVAATNLALEEEVAKLKRALSDAAGKADAPPRDPRLSPLETEVEELKSQVKELEKMTGVKDPFARDSRHLSARVKALETDLVQLKQRK